VSDIPFVQIMDVVQQRIQSIDGTGDFYNDFSAAVHLEGMQPVPKIEDLPVGAVLVVPGEATTVEGEGVRMQTVSLEYLVDRPIEIFIVAPLADKDTFLVVAEEACKDIRRALFKDAPEWIGAGLKHIFQGGQDFDRPQPGSNALHVRQLINIRYRDA